MIFINFKSSLHAEVFLEQIMMIRIIRILNTHNKLLNRELSLIIFVNNVRGWVRIYHLLAWIENRNRPELHPGLAPYEPGCCGSEMGPYEAELSP